jgi:hypothetical protein
MKSIIYPIGFFFAIGLSGATAQSAEDHHPLCTSLQKVQKEVGKGTSVIQMTRAQFNFLQGMYVAMPTTPDGLPPGDGALIIKSDLDDSGMIIWTRGPLACSPLMVPKLSKLLGYLIMIKAGGSGGDDL